MGRREPPILTGLLSPSSRVLLAPHSWSSSSPVLLAGPSRSSCSSSSVQFGEPLNRVRTSIFACAVFEYLYSLVNHDVKTNTLFKSTSVSLVWLTRYMDFLVELFRNLREHHLDWVTIRAVYNAYAKTLIKWHDEKIVLTLIPFIYLLGSKYSPEKDLLLKVIGGNGDVMGDMEKFCTSFTPLLKQNHEFLAGMDDLKLFCASLVAKVPSTFPKQRKMGKTMFAPTLEELETEFGNVVYPVTFDIRTCVVIFIGGNGDVTGVLAGNAPVALSVGVDGHDLRVADMGDVLVRYCTKRFTKLVQLSLV
ncbi:hypothetical protein DVH24_026383 [Malus domestica]|uniref:Glycolipid transfer protein domain-containing protein n=1 Tax=Malus domestica TaxID=3750 RepID=A0A498KIG2_MALDO|nr:hypothetical protein DVH24_026383 [Malus domestica]